MLKFLKISGSPFGSAQTQLNLSPKHFCSPAHRNHPLHLAIKKNEEQKRVVEMKNKVKRHIAGLGVEREGLS